MNKIITHKWYILNVMAGQEQKIANDIRTMITTGKSGGKYTIDFSKYVEDVLVPCKQVIKIEKGQKVQKSQKLFPGYIFVKADLHSDAYNIINSIPKSMGFLGEKNNPEAVSDEKMNYIFSLIDGVSTGEKNQIFEKGEIVDIIEGPFESFSGSVEKFDSEKHRVVVLVSIFGRSTSVELDIAQIKKISS